MQGELQQIVDTVADRVGRAALVEDRHQQVLAYSAHEEPLDDVRRDSILTRHTTPEVIAWFRAAGVHRTRTPVRTPAAPELGLLPRVCLPIVHHDLLLGFMWFIDADGSMSAHDIATAAAAAEDRVPRAAPRRSAGRSGVAARGGGRPGCCCPTCRPPGARRRKELLADGVVTDDGPVTALVVQPVGDAARSALEQALVLTRRWHGARSAVHLVRRDHGVLLLSGEGPPGRWPRIWPPAACPGDPDGDRGGRAVSAAGRRDLLLPGGGAHRPGRGPAAVAGRRGVPGRRSASTGC